MPPTLHWLDQAVPFRAGETIAAALRRAGIDHLGAASGGMSGRYFCGIGTCQNCLVSVNGGAAVEACLTLAVDGTRLSPGLPGFGQEGA